MPNTELFPKVELSPAHETRQRVAAQIEDAFAQTPYPGDDKIAKPDTDGASLTRAFWGKNWRDVQLTTLSNYHVDLPLMTPEAFRYYVPAFMLATMFYYHHVSTLPMGLMHSLTPPDPTLLQKYLDKKTDPLKHSQITDFLNRVGAFTTTEKAAIRAFLENYTKWQPDARSETRHLQRAADFWRTA